MSKKEQTSTSEYQAERAILSAILNYSHAMEIVSESLRLYHFTDPTNKIIYEACCELNVEDIAIDFVTADDLLKRKGKELSIHLAELPTEISTSANVIQHAELLVDHYVKGCVLNLTKDLPDGLSGYATFAEVQARMAAIEKELSTTADETLFTTERLEECISRLTNDDETQSRIFKSGISDLDNIIGGFQSGTVTALQGLYKTGKTKLLLMILSRVANTGVPVGLLSLEMGENRVRDWVLSHVCRIDSRFFKTSHSREWETDRQGYLGRIKDRAGNLVDLPFYVNDVRRPTVDQVAAIIAKWARNGIKVVGLDYFERMETGIDWKQEGIVTARLADIAARHDIALIYADQLNKTAEQKGSGTSLAHSRGSITRCADADVLLQMKNLSSRERKQTEGDKMSEIEMLIIERDGISGKRIKLLADLSVGWFAGKEERGELCL